MYETLVSAPDANVQIIKIPQVDNEESPELLLGRPDEGLMYHVPPDIGFTLLNPPINLGK